MIHPDTVIRTISEDIGIGVYASSFIPRGTIVVARDSFDLSFTQEEFRKLPFLMRNKMKTYMYHDKNGHLVMSWDHARYMNHSCDSNTLMTDYNFEIAIRDIQPGDEITTDYGLLNVQEPYELLCGCHNCRGILRRDDLDCFSDIWDQSILDSLLQIKKVPQPLENLLSAKDRERLETVLHIPIKYSSIRNQ